ncbi:unnamed protein product [Pedinophyceae sp. YPF-701]|nr:unnamed protein product [Pedinophyceae sp. YPF-701]
MIEPKRAYGPSNGATLNDSNGGNQHRKGGRGKGGRAGRSGGHRPASAAPRSNTNGSENRPPAAANAAGAGPIPADQVQQLTEAERRAARAERFGAAGGRGGDRRRGGKERRQRRDDALVCAAPRVPDGVPEEDRDLYGPRLARGPKGKNTQSFDPERSQRPADMRVVVARPDRETLGRPFMGRDVVFVPDFFCHEDDKTAYDQLLKEITEQGKEGRELFVPWHGDSHVIASDNLYDWSKCPTFKSVVQKIEAYFNMHVQATRFNWYRDDAEWKPYHHDAAAIKPRFSTIQNCTVAVSFGRERDCAFEHAASGATVSVPQPNGSAYAFGRDVNVEWRHGVPQLPEARRTGEGRVSIIAWGWVDQVYERGDAQRKAHAKVQ